MKYFSNLSRDVICCITTFGKCRSLQSKVLGWRQFFSEWDEFFPASRVDNSSRGRKAVYCFLDLHFLLPHLRWIVLLSIYFQDLRNIHELLRVVATADYIRLLLRDRSLHSVRSTNIIEFAHQSLIPGVLSVERWTDQSLLQMLYRQLLFFGCTRTSNSKSSGRLHPTFILFLKLAWLFWHDGYSLFPVP